MNMVLVLVGGLGGRARAPLVRSCSPTAANLCCRQEGSLCAWLPPWCMHTLSHRLALVNCEWA